MKIANISQFRVHYTHTHSHTHMCVKGSTTGGSGPVARGGTRAGDTYVVLLQDTHMFTHTQQMD